MADKALVLGVTVDGWVSLVSKINGVCCVCDAGIRSGQQVRWKEGHGAMHPICWSLWQGAEK